MTHYYKVLLIGCQRFEEDDIADFCFSFGAEGLSEVLSFTQDDPSNYAPKTILSPVFNLEVYFQNKPSVEFFAEIRKIFTINEVVCTEEPNKDWLEEWKKGYKAFPLVRDLWVVPSWEKAPSEAKKYISIDPGMAFGTGTHDTTQLVSQLLIGALEEEGAKTLLDVGTGSAILAILASHLGVKHSWGIDNDPECLRVARENVILNGVQSTVTILDESVAELNKNFDIVLANIIDGVLLGLKPHLISKLTVGGRLILSGILLERWSKFQKEFVESSGLRVVALREQGEWLGVVLRA